MRRYIKCCIWIFLLLQASPSFSAQAWTQHARDLFTGDENKAAKSKEWFSTHPEAYSDLLNGLNDPEEEHLALDTLVSLGRHDVVPTLLDRLAANTDGSYALALSALMNKENAPQILGRFKSLVESDRSAALPLAAVLPIVDTLGRLQVPLSDETFKRLSTKYHPEVRLSLIQYMRENAAVRPRPYPTWLYESLLKDSVYQVRLSALALQREYPKTFPKAPALEACRLERHQLLRQFCQRFFHQEPAS
jgi:hypothetical protein